MKHIWKLAIFLLALNLYGQDTSHTAQKIYSGPSSSGSCAYSATAPDPVLVVGGVLYVCGPGNTFVPTGGRTSNYQTVQVAGAAQPVEPALNFPSGVACTDNPGVATNCTPSANYQTVQVAGAAQPVEPALNFPSGVACTDNPGVATNCTPSANYQTVQVAGAAQPVEPALNFPSGVACTDNPGVATNCTPSASALPMGTFGGTASSATSSPAQNGTKGNPFYVTYEATGTHLLYDVTAADNSGNVYNIGYYGPGCSGAASGVPLVAETGPVAGSTLAASPGLKSYVSTLGSFTLYPGNFYCEVVTTSAASPVLALGGGASATNWVPWQNASFGSTSGAVLPATITAPVGSISLGFQVYAGVY